MKIKNRWTWIADKVFQQNGMAYRVMVGIPYSWQVSSSKKLRRQIKRRREADFALLRRFKQLKLVKP